MVCESVHVCVCAHVLWVPRGGGVDPVTTLGSYPGLTSNSGLQGVASGGNPRRVNYSWMTHGPQHDPRSMSYSLCTRGGRPSRTP